jgi:hypothetical protein
MIKTFEEYHKDKKVEWISIEDETPENQEKVVILLGKTDKGHDYIDEVIYKNGAFIDQRGKRVENVKFWRRKNFYNELWKNKH